MWLSVLYAGRGTHLPPAVSAAFITLIPNGGWPLGNAGWDLDALPYTTESGTRQELGARRGPDADRTVELAAVAVDVPAGKNLYLTVSPVADMFAGQRGPLPGALLLKTATLTYRTLSRYAL
jgi:ABC-2 type transport system ATP-binding protein